MFRNFEIFFPPTMPPLNRTNSTFLGSHLFLFSCIHLYTDVIMVHTDFQALFYFFCLLCFSKTWPCGLTAFVFVIIRADVTPAWDPSSFHNWAPVLGHLGHSFSHCSYLCAVYLYAQRFSIMLNNFLNFRVMGSLGQIVQTFSRLLPRTPACTPKLLHPQTGLPTT